MSARIFPKGTHQANARAAAANVEIETLGETTWLSRSTKLLYQCEKTARLYPHIQTLILHYSWAKMSHGPASYDLVCANAFRAEHFES